MTPEEREEFNKMKEDLRRLQQIFDDAFAGKPEGIGQVVVSQVVPKSPTAARILRIRTTQGEYNILAE